MKILHKNKALLSLIAFLAIIFSIGMAFDYKAPEIEAGAGDNISGWAWANTPQSLGDPKTGTDQGIGWISFNCTDTGTCNSPNLDYGVNIDFEGTKTMSGLAWSENIGFLSFESGDLSGCPAGTCSASIDTSVDPYELRGWGRVLSMSDGWVSLNCKDAGVGVCGDSNYKVTMNPTTGKFSGWAWGSDVVGWIDFAPSSAVLGGINVGYNNASGAGVTECNDAIDNDGDGLIDNISVNPVGYDTGCISASDPSEHQAPNYSIRSSNDLTVSIPGTSTETDISIIMVQGDPLVTTPIQLSATSNIPGAVTYNFSQPSISSPYSSSQTVQFSVTVPAGTPDAPYTIVITATATADDGLVYNQTVPVLLNSDSKAGKFRER